MTLEAGLQKKAVTNVICNGLSSNDNPIYQWDNDCKKKLNHPLLKKSFNFLPLTIPYRVRI
jgi:hypothetical protein